MKNRKPNRLQGYDYGKDNLYYVTSCVKNMECSFGEVVNQEMILNEYGNIAEKKWFWLSEQYPYTALHQFVVMPNHIHGIIEIDSNQNAGMKIKSLSELIGAYKTTVSKQIHLLGNSTFSWQRSFYEHIIRDENAYNKISEYIMNNPLRWGRKQKL